MARTPAPPVDRDPRRPRAPPASFVSKSQPQAPWLSQQEITSPRRQNGRVPDISCEALRPQNIFVSHPLWASPTFLKDRPPVHASLPGRLRAAQLGSFSRRTWTRLAGATRGLAAIVRPTLEKPSVQTGAPSAQLAQYPADPWPFSPRIGAECPQRCQRILSL